LAEEHINAEDVGDMVGLFESMISIIAGNVGEKWLRV
jgi:hypothetical protein